VIFKILVVLLIRQKTGEYFSPERIREELYRVQESILRYKVNNDRYVVPSKPSQDVKKIYNSSTSAALLL